MLHNRTTANNFWGGRLQYFTSTRGMARPFKSFRRLRRSGRLTSWWAAHWTNKKVARIHPCKTLTKMKETTQHRNSWIILNSCKGKWYKWMTTRGKLFRRTSAWKACGTIRRLCTRIETPKATSTRITFSWAALRVETWQKAWSHTSAPMQMKWMQMLIFTLDRVARPACGRASYFRCRSTRPLNFTHCPRRLRIALKDRWEIFNASKPKRDANPSVKWPSSPAKWPATRGRSTSVRTSWFITLPTSIACH